MANAGAAGSKTVTRLYVVTEQLATPMVGDALTKESLVRASSQAQAIACVTKGRFKAEVATTDDAVSLTAQGVKMLEAGS